METTQSNTLAGAVVLPAGEALTDLEGRLITIIDAGSFAEAKLPDAVSDLALHILDEGAADTEDVTILPLDPSREMRVRLNGTVSAGATLVLAAINGTDDGKVRTIPATEGVYFSPGIALQDGVDEQLVKFRPLPRLVHVGTAFTAATPASTAATNSSPYGFSQAQADSILTNVREMRAFMVAQGWKATS